MKNDRKEGITVKKPIAFLLALVMAVSLAGCGAGSETPDNSTAAPSSSSPDASIETPSSSEGMGSAENLESEPSERDGSNILIAYFSWADNAILEGEVDAIASPSVTAPGNVAQLASWVQEETGGDLFSIRVTEPYSSDWDECLARANDERSQNARPELVEKVENIGNYDVVFLGYPNWWYGAPMALLSFIEENDLSDKQIYLFCSHGTGGLAGSVGDIEDTMPDSAALSDNVFDVYEEDASSSQDDILNWLSELGY